MCSIQKLSEDLLSQSTYMLALMVKNRINYFAIAGDNMAAISRRKPITGTNSAAQLKYFIENIYVSSALFNVLIFR